MQWVDRVYGWVTIEDPRILELVACPTFDRLRRVRQAGPSAYAFPFKDVTRHEHSLGVYLLLRRLGAPWSEQVAGLLHDISHTAFSHAVDFVFDSDEQALHEELKHLFLEREDLARALERIGLDPFDFYDDGRYPLLEQPLPRLCADRIDYFLRDSLTCGVITPAFAQRVLEDLRVVDGVIAFQSPGVAHQAVAAYEEMNRDWWASDIEAFIYNEFADVIREGFRLGALTTDDLLEDEPHVLAQLQAAGSRFIEAKLEAIFHFDPARVPGYQPRVVPKQRWIDPPIVDAGQVRPFSEVS